MATNGVQTISNYKFVDAKATIGIGIAIPVICVFVVGLRFLTRFLQKNIIGLDDWLSAGSLVRLLPSVAEVRLGDINTHHSSQL